MSAGAQEPVHYDVFPLAEVQSDPDWHVLAEAVNESLAAFRCEKSAHLEEFARSKVALWERHGHSRTYVMIVANDRAGIDVAAFFTIGMTMLDLSNSTLAMKKKLGGEITMAQTGAFSIAELARSDAYSPTQLPGSVILDEAKNVIREARRLIGGRFVVVDSQRNVFEALYKPAGFRIVDVAKPPIGMEGSDFVTSCAVAKDW